MQVTRLRVYPVKSFAGNDVNTAEVLPWGLAGDRRWGLVDPQGAPVTARVENVLLGFSATMRPGGGLVLTARDGSAHEVDVPAGAAPIAVGHSRQGEALPAPAADAWLSERIGGPVRLVWQPDPGARPVNPANGGLPGDAMTLADSAPLLLTSEASLAQLDEWTDADTPPLDMLRFRPSVVIDGDAPFAEDDWTFVRLGDVRFRVIGVCDRCVMTTIDPVTLERGKEPVRTLAVHRRWDGKTWFGVWLVPEVDGGLGAPMVRVGDAVRPEA